MPADEGKFGFKKKRKPAGDDCGCEMEDYAADVAGAFAAAETETTLEPDPRGTTVRRWQGLLAPIGVPTGDGRRFAANSLSSRDLPLPVRWPRTDEGGHKSSVTVGRIDGIDYADDGEVSAWGIIFDPDPEKLPRLKQDADEAYFLLESKTLGPSVDLDDMDFRVLEGEEFASADGKQEIEVTKGRISAITLVPIPAFSQARPFALDALDADQYAEMTAVTAAAVTSGMAELPVAVDAEWNPVAWMADETNELGALYASGGTVAFPVAQRIDGRYQLVPGAVADAVSVLAYRADELTIGPGAQQAMRAELEALTAACGLPNPPWAQEALVAAAGLLPSAPPAALFADPKFTEPTPISITKTPEGWLHYRGHVASWGVCHIGFPGKCVTAPRSRTQYSYFHVGSTETADRGRIMTGKITLGGGHADTRMGFQAALSHYDESGTAAADVRAGEDAYGIWVSGVVRPGVDESRLAELASAPLSGDWRHVGGGLEMVAALAVNTPGFPVVSVRRRGQEDFALVAAGALHPQEPAAISPEGRSIQELVRVEFARQRRAQRAVEAFGSLVEVDARERVAAAAQMFA